MNASGGIPWQKHPQVGSLQAIEGCRLGSVTNEVRIRCKCIPTSLIADVSLSVVQDSKPSDVAHRGPLNLIPELGDSQREGLSQQSGYLPVPSLFAQAGQVRYRTGRGSGSAGLQFSSGRLFLRGETVLVSRGVVHFQPHSQLAVEPGIVVAASGFKIPPPTVSGVPIQDLLAHVASDLEGTCLFYCPTDRCLQLSSRQPALKSPLMHLCGNLYNLEKIARLTADRVRPATPADFPNSIKGLFMITQSPLPPPPSPQQGQESESTLPPRRNLLLVGGRCLLRGDSLFLLSGLIHFAGAWRRIQQYPEQQQQQAPPQPPPRLTGASILLRRLKRARSSVGNHSLLPRKPSVSDPEFSPNDLHQLERMMPKMLNAPGESEDSDPDLEFDRPLAMDRPLLLSNVWLYAQAGTVFVGSTPLLSSAVIYMSPEIPPAHLEMQERLLSKLPPQSRLGAVRLFIQRGSFSVNSGGQLKVTAGVAWLRAKKVQLGESPRDQLTINDALIFPQPTGNPQDAVHFNGRDLLYKDGLLYLEDLTPILAGGKVYFGELEWPLEWLSGFDRGPSSQGSSLYSPSEADSYVKDENLADNPFETSAKFESDSSWELLTDGVCLLDASANLHILRGRLKLPGMPIIPIDQGVAHFVGGSSVDGPSVPPRPDDPAGFPPPRIIGRTLMTRPKDARQWAKFVDHRLDRAVFEDANLAMRRGIVWLNSRVPLLKGCCLLLTSRRFGPHELCPAAASKGQRHQTQHTSGFTGTYSVFTNCHTEALVFSMKARFPDNLQFLFGP